MVSQYRKSPFFCKNYIFWALEIFPSPRPTGTFYSQARCTRQGWETCSIPSLLHAGPIVANISVSLLTLVSDIGFDKAFLSFPASFRVFLFLIWATFSFSISVLCKAFKQSLKALIAERGASPAQLRNQDSGGGDWRGV